MNILSNYVKLTSTTISNDDLSNIITYFDQLDINIDNLHMVLKIISNIVINNLIKMNLSIDSIIDKYDNLLTDGHVICLIKIYSTSIYDNPSKAIYLTNKYVVHKTSSYVPIFNHLITLNDDQTIIELYMQLITQNNLITESNREIKDYNYKARLYNENIKILKNKQLEIESIINIVRDIKIDSNPYMTNNLSIRLPFDELKYKTEQNLIILTDSIIDHIIKIAIYKSNYCIIRHIINNYTINHQNLQYILNTLQHTNTRLDINNRCDCCKQKISLNIINDDDQMQILKLLKDKILNTNHRTDNGILIDKSELININNRYEELHLLLDTIDFNIVIDGGNLGLSNQTTQNEININYMRKIINQLLINTNKPILLIIHQRHHKKIKQLNINNPLLKILLTPHKLDDDLFWLYAAISANAYILTKDQSRNNSCMISYQTEIKKFLNYYQFNTDRLTDINKNKINENSIVLINNKIHIKLDTDKLICI